MTLQGVPLHLTDLAEVMEYVKENINNNLNCHQTGTIQSFDAITQTATVSINSKRLIATNPDTWQNYPLLVDIPVIILGNSTARITLPINQGDECLIFFNDREIDNWYAQGGNPTFSIGRTHDISDAVILVGLRNSTKALSTYNNEAIELNNGDTVKLSIYSDHIEITGTLNSLNDIIAGTISLQNHTHTTTTEGMPTSPPIL